MAKAIITNAGNKHDLKLVRRSSAEKHLMIQISLRSVTPFECSFALLLFPFYCSFFGKQAARIPALSNISFVHECWRAHLQISIFLMSLLLVQRWLPCVRYRQWFKFFNLLARPQQGNADASLSPRILFHTAPLRQIYSRMHVLWGTLEASLANQTDKAISQLKLLSKRSHFW